MNGSETLFPNMTEEVAFSSEEEESQVAAEKQAEADDTVDKVLPREMSASSSGLSGNISNEELDENLEVQKIF